MPRPLSLELIQHSLLPRQLNRGRLLFAALNTTRVRWMSVGLIVFLGITYLWLVNSSASAGFYLSDLEARRVTLEDEYEKLEVEQTAIRSLEQLEKRSEALQMVSSKRAEHLPKEQSVALGGE